MAKEKEQVVIQGPSGDLIQIARTDFGGSHYEEQGYEVAGPAPTEDAEAPKDVPPADVEPAE